MVKVALCLSGQPRNYRDTFPFIYKHIIEPNNADVFFHTWFDESNRYMEKTHIDRGDCYLNEHTIEELLVLYKPVRYLVEKPKDFQKPSFQIPESRIQRSQELNAKHNWPVEKHISHTIKQMTSMFYSIFKSNELKENYANENGVTYDYVIRLRFDCVPLMPIVCSTLNPNVIYYQDLGHPDELISDWINIGSNAIMNVFSSIYLHLEYLNTYTFFSKELRPHSTIDNSDTCSGLYEYLIRDIMTLFKIPKRGMQFHCLLHKNA